MNKKYVVVKFHDKEKYAVAVYKDGKHECEVYAARARGIYHDTPYVKFGIYEEGHYDACVDMEQRMAGSVYDLLTTTNYSEHLETKVTMADV